MGEAERGEAGDSTAAEIGPPATGTRTVCSPPPPDEENP